jgi:hypothetical protein
LIFNNLFTFGTYDMRLAYKKYNKLQGRKMKKVSLFSAKALLQSALVVGAFLASTAYATTVSWTGSSDFDNEAITFAPIQASQMQFLDGGWDGYQFAEYHSHGGSVTAELNLQLNGVWTNVYTGSVTGGQDFWLNGLTVNFDSSQVTGAQWTTPTPQYQTYHGFYNVGLDFTDPNPVPEPTTVALFGLGLMGVMASRRKATKNKNA